MPITPRLRLMPYHTPLASCRVNYAATVTRCLAYHISPPLFDLSPPSLPLRLQITASSLRHAWAGGIVDDAFTQFSFRRHYVIAADDYVAAAIAVADDMSRLLSRLIRHYWASLRGVAMPPSQPPLPYC